MSSREIRIGIRLPVAGPLASTEAIRLVATEAEKLGYDDVWLHDLIAWSRIADQSHISCGSYEAVERAGPESAPQFFESLTTLAFVAGMTKRIGIGVSVLVLPWRHPVVAAKQVATVDALSGGRLTLGVGVGGNRSARTTEFELLGVDRRVKYALTRETLQGLKSLWTEKYPRFHGRFVNFDFAEYETELNPKPRGGTGLPILVGGAGPKSMAIAAEEADGWLPLWLTPQDYGVKVPEVRELARQAGRDPRALRIGGTFPALVDTSTADAWRQARRTVETMTHGYADGPSPEHIQRTSFIGGPDDLIQRFEDYTDAEVSTFELRFIYHDISHLLTQLELFAETVLPAVRNMSRSRR